MGRVRNRQLTALPALLRVHIISTLIIAGARSCSTSYLVAHLYVRQRGIDPKICDMAVSVEVTNLEVAINGQDGDS